MESTFWINPVCQWVVIRHVRYVICEAVMSVLSFFVSLFITVIR